jgi:hypothetical protein
LICVLLTCFLRRIPFYQICGLGVLPMWLKWYTACLATSRPWVHTPVPPKINN